MGDDSTYVSLIRVLWANHRAIGQNRWDDLQAFIEGTFRLSNAISSSVVPTRNVTLEKKSREKRIEGAN